MLDNVEKNQKWFGGMFEGDKDCISNSDKNNDFSSTFMDEFLLKLNHEVRTPLNAIIGFSDVLLDDEDSDEKKEIIGHIRKAGNTLLSFINDLIDVSSNNAGVSAVNSNLFSVRIQLLGIQEKYKLLCAQKELDFKLIIDDSVPEIVFGDEHKLGQILIKLLDNAVKFTIKGAVVLKCHSKDNLLFITISDSGIGIPKKLLKNVFIPFNKTDPQIKQIYGGMGLGLTLAVKLTEIMGGELFAHSKEGEGSVFTLIFPFPEVGNTIQDFWAKGELGTIKEFAESLPTLQETECKVFYSSVRVFRKNLLVMSADDVKKAAASLLTINNEYIKKTGEFLYHAAEQFDDRAVKQIITRLEEVLKYVEEKS